MASGIKSGLARGAYAGLLLLCLSVAGLLGQQQPAFRAETDLVTLHVAVEDLRRQFVLDVRGAEFSVFDGKAALAVGAVVPPPGVVTVKFLVDHWGGMARHEAGVRQTIEGALDRQVATSRSGVGSYLFHGSPFAGDRAAVLAGLRAVMDRRRQSYRAAVSFAWTGIERARAGFNAPADSARLDFSSAWASPGSARWSPGPASELKSIVILSGGTVPDPPPTVHTEETIPDFAETLRNPRARIQSIIDATVRAGIVVFTLAFEPGNTDRELEALSLATGGTFTRVDRRTDLRAAGARIMEDLTSRYLIGFTPAAFDGSDHRLTVRVARPDVTVRTRAFYRAPKAPQ